MPINSVVILSFLFFLLVRREILVSKRVCVSKSVIKLVHEHEFLKQFVPSERASEVISYTTKILSVSLSKSVQFSVNCTTETEGTQ